MTEQKPDLEAIEKELTINIMYLGGLVSRAAAIVKEINNFACKNFDCLYDKGVISFSYDLSDDCKQWLGALHLRSNFPFRKEAFTTVEDTPNGWTRYSFQQGNLIYYYYDRKKEGVNK